MIGAAMPAAPPDMPPAQAEKLWHAAQDFEAMALGELLSPMFQTIDVAHAPFGGGEAEAMWQPMLVDAIAKQTAAHGGLGLAPQVFAAMLHAQEGKR